MVIRSPKVLRLWLLGVPPHPQVRIHGCTSATRRITQKIFIPGLPIKSCFIYRLILVVQFNNFVPTSKGSQRGTYEKSNHSLLACKTVEVLYSI